MTQFIGVAEMAKLVRTIGIETFLAELADHIRQDFLRWPEFEKMARIATHSADGVIELMPASDSALYGFKYVNGHPNNPAKTGLSTVMAFGVLADVATGMPLLISEMTLLTALRTAATSAMAARALARKESTVLALIGAGAQSEFQALAMKAIIGIEEVRVFDPDPEAVDKFVRNMAGSGLTIVRATSVRDAVRGADIVTTATAVKGRAAVITPDMLEPGMHINAIGGDCPGKTELHPDVLRLGTVFVEYPPQTRIEGDIQQMEPDFPVVELWQVLAGAATGRASREEITVFDSVGFAVEDFASLRYVAGLLEADEHQMDLIPQVGDPKDLFGEVLGAIAPAAPLDVPAKAGIHAAASAR
jgi:ornithine cyclodeaminase